MAQASSSVTTVVAPTLMGIWLHSVADPQNTSSNFLYGNIGRTESLGIQGAPLRFIGRTHPVYDTGGFESQSLNCDVVIPYGPDEQDQVDWFRSAVRNRATLCYRDSRGRVHYVIIVSIGFADERVGTRATFTAATIDYTEEI